MQKASDFHLLRRGGGTLSTFPLWNERRPSSQAPSRTQSEQPPLWAAAAWEQPQQQHWRRLSDSNSCLAEARRGLAAARRLLPVLWGPGTPVLSVARVGEMGRSGTQEL